MSVVSAESTPATASAAAPTPPLAPPPRAPSPSLCSPPLSAAGLRHVDHSTHRMTHASATTAQQSLLNGPCVRIGRPSRSDHQPAPLSAAHGGGERGAMSGEVAEKAGSSGTGGGSDDVTAAVSLAERLAAAKKVAEEAVERAREALAAEMALPEDDVAARRAARKERKKAKKAANKLTQEVRRLEKEMRLGGFSNEAEKAAAAVTEAAVPQRPKRLRLRLQRPKLKQAATGRIRAKGPVAEEGCGFRRRLRYHGLPIPEPPSEDSDDGDTSEAPSRVRRRVRVGSQSEAQDAAQGADGDGDSNVADGDNEEGYGGLVLPPPDEPYETRAFPLK